MELLVDQLRSTDKEARRKVIRELESYGKEAVKPLIQALKDGDNKVRQRAASALGRIGDRRAVEPLILALHDSDMFTRVFAADALGKIGDERAVEPLIQALKDKLVSVRYSAADALGKIGDERAVEPLIQALEWGSAQMDIINALGRLGDARAVEPLIEVLRYGGDYVPRVCAAAALGEIGDERAIEPLTEALNDEEKDVRQAAKYALTRIMKERGFSKLDVQLMLERSLEDFREGGVEFLTKALSSGDLLVRLKAVRVLGEMRDEGAVEPLVRALSSHSHCYIRFRAHEALVRMGEVAVDLLLFFPGYSLLSQSYFHISCFNRTAVYQNIAQPFLLL